VTEPAVAVPRKTAHAERQTAHAEDKPKVRTLATPPRKLPTRKARGRNQHTGDPFAAGLTLRARSNPYWRLVVLLAIPATSPIWMTLREAPSTRCRQRLRSAAIAAADVGYCSPELKKILRRVLMSCGLVGGDAARGCQPVQAKNVATMTGSDFNALFRPMKERGGIIQFDLDKSELDAGDLTLVDKVFADQRGASWFFVVARSSPEGSIVHNRDLSKGRAESVMKHLRERFKDPDLDKEVGMLWLGEEFAQLEEEFCQWNRSDTGECKTQELNRSAFVA
jgi:outer membrane protein OmpA-like peptidoglycan-associated protein